MSPRRRPTGPVERALDWVKWVRKELSLSRVQSTVAIVTGLVTILGAVYSFRHVEQPPPTGDLVAIVQDAMSQEPVIGAAVEVLTLQDALVVRLTPDSRGRVRQSLKEGAYRVRVSHPNYSAESRKVQVTSQQTVEVRMALRPGSSVPLDQAKDAITGGAKAVGRMLGFKNK